ncbi:MAG: FAD-dependent oxidoreductase [Desulfobacterales bacterium]
MKHVDAIVIGSGQGGVPLAAEFSRQGKAVVMFERSRVGGSCINWGCTPSKAFLAAAHAAGRARDAEHFGLIVKIDIDFARVMERVRRIRDNFTEGSEQRLQRAGVTLIRKEAAFDDEGHVCAGTERFSAPLVIVDTGSSPIAPPLEGLNGVPFLTDRNFWDLEHLPKRTIILGAGYIGLEIGQGLARLGSRVRIIDQGDRPMIREGPEVSAVLKEALETDGIRFHLAAQIDRVDYTDEVYHVQLSDNTTLEGDALLIAAGRRPNTDALNAASAGIELDDRGCITIDERFESTRKGVYAIGEAAGQPPFTHVAWEDYRRLLGVLSGIDRSPNDRVLGYAAFTEPQLARAGFSLEEARRQGFEAISRRMEVKNMARAIEWGHRSGFYELVVDARTDRIIGATLVGYEAGELIHILLDLIEAEATWRQLESAQHIHPTYAENLPTLARMFDQDEG